ncbi:MAG TPA: hypothetical protein VEV41_04935 [Terriglobales bacterium]|nr:hypothetical protein [Terriglobales bacterium]
MAVSRAIRIAMAALSIAALSVLLSAQAGQNTYDPASGKAPSRSQNSFLDFTLKRINPAGQDYGKCFEEGRALLLDESVRNGYFWSNLVALSLLGCLLLIIMYQHRLQTRRDWAAARIVAEYEQALARSHAQVDQVTKSNHGLNDALAAIREPALRSTLKHQNSAQRTSSIATEDRAPRPQPASPPPRATPVKPAIERGANIGVATGSAPQMAPSKLEADIVARINLLEQQLAYAQEENKQLRQRVAEGDRRLEPEQQGVTNSRGHRPPQKGRTTMSGDQRSSRKPRQGMLNKFEPAGESGPIEDPTEREQRLNQLPAGEKDLARESARLADLCQYFSEEKMDIPADLVDRIGTLSRLEPGERVRELLSINQALMEYLNRVGSGPQLWP